MSSCTYLHPCQSPIGFTQMFWLVSCCCVMCPYVHNSFICTKIEWNMKRIKAQISNQIRLRIFESQINWIGSEQVSQRAKQEIQYRQRWHMPDTNYIISEQVRKLQRHNENIVCLQNDEFAWCNVLLRW